MVCFLYERRKSRLFCIGYYDDDEYYVVYVLFIACVGKFILTPGLCSSVYVFFFFRVLDRDRLYKRIHRGTFHA